MTVRLAGGVEHPSSSTILLAWLGGINLAATAASKNIISDKPLLDGIPDTGRDEAEDDTEDDTDGVQGAEVVEPTSLASGLGLS